MSALRVALAHYRRQVALARRAAEEVARLWVRIDRQAIGPSWAASVPAAVQVLATAQALAAASATLYLDDVLEAQGIDPTPEGRIQPAAFAGVASDGRDLAALLYQPAITALSGVKQGETVPRALAGGRLALDMIVRTQVADAGRTADGVAVVARRQVGGYVRLLSPPSCSRCVVLAGRWYRWNAGFLRHPRCFPAGTVVSGPGADGATRRWYQGELVVIRTASGKNLAVTGNHPILTSQGWLPANLLREGGDVVSRTSGDRSGAILVPDHDQMPSRIEDLWRADGMRSLGRVPVSAEDFHGDGFGSSHVDVVLADRLLGDRVQVAELKELGQELLAFGAEPAVSLSGACACAQLGLGSLAASCGVVRCGCLGGALGLGHLAGANDAGLARPPDGYIGVHEALANYAAADAEAVCQGVLALASEVGGHDRGGVDVAVAPRWDAPPDPFSVESRVAYASRGDDLRFRLAGKVEVDRVVEVRRVEWSGHVYNLTSREGWYDANGIIVSNCDCRHIPAAEDTSDELATDPKQYFDSLPREEQDRAFTQAGAEAIRLGADISQVVNARRGARGLTPAGARLTAAEAKALRGGRDRGRLETVNVFGHDLFVTTEGTTTRGVAGVRLGAKETGTKQGRRYRSAKAPRLMPESVLQIAGNDRDEAIRLLKRYGYLL